MAYAAAGLCPAGGQSTRGITPQMWLYNTTDTIATVNTSGYFNDASDMMTVGDLIYAVTSTGGTRVHSHVLVLTNASGVVDVSDGVVIATTDGD